MKEKESDNMKPYEALNFRDKCNIISYIDEYMTDNGINQKIELEKLPKILNEWDKNKGNLFEMFGNELILKKEIKVKKSEEQLEDEITEVLLNLAFIKHFHTKVINKYDYYDREFNILSSLIRTSALMTNEFDHPEDVEITFPDSYKKVLKLHRGEKIMKILSKLVKIFELDEELFEEFRLAHSRILNNKEFKGTLHLSIHPMDYMTMSDNANNWSSCMNWTECGDYHKGTVEMMNSPYVVVAYLASSKNFEYGDAIWNSKKWRELFIVDDHIISGIRAYPFEHEELETQVLQWLKKLYTSSYNQDNWSSEILTHSFRNYSFDAPYDQYTVRLFTRDMYNDTAHHNTRMYLNLSTNINYELNYSGIFTCMCCGESFDASENTVICEECYAPLRCSCCNEILDEDEACYFNGEYYCESCYSELPYCEICNDIVDEEDLIALRLIEKENNKTYKCYYFFANLCYDCFDKLKEEYNLTIVTENNETCVVIDENCPKEFLDKCGFDPCSSYFTM